MAGTDPSGTQPTTSRAPDGEPFSTENYPIDWSQPSRERGIVRHPAGGRSFEAAIATVAVGADGGIASPGSVESKLDAILDELRSMRLGMVWKDLIEDVNPPS